MNSIKQKVLSIKNKLEKIREESKFFKYIVIAVILLIPFMYSFFYLKAFWDPYGNLGDVNIAIVNKDTASSDNKGDELIKEIENSDSIHVNVVDEKTALDGLYNKKYYAMITIPEDFTLNLENASNSSRAQTIITYSPNQKTNYLASQIISRIVLEVESSLNSNINKAIVGQLTDTIQSVPDELETMRDGLGQLGSGATQLQDGTSKLNEGTNTLENKYSEFNQGLSTALEGSNKLTSSMEELDSGLSKLDDGIDNLSSSTSSLSDLEANIDTLKNGSDHFTSNFDNYVVANNQVLTASKSFAGTLIALSKTNPELFADTSSGLYQALMAATKLYNDGTYDQLIGSASSLEAGNNAINSGISDLNTAVSTNVPKLTSGIELLKTSSSTIKSGSSQILSGAKTLNSGLTILSENSNNVDSAISTVNSSTFQLLTGTRQLNDGISTAKNSVDENISDVSESSSQLTGLDQYASAPVNIDEKDVNQIDAYGVSFSPYFMSISLWVGALVLFVVLFFDITDRFPLFSRNAKSRTKRTFAYLGLAALQGILLGGLLKLCLGFEVQNILLYYFVVTLVAVAFEAIIEFLIVNFHDIGKFIVLVLLVFQLSASGGTFPIETTPEFFQDINKFMPMKYTIDLYKETIISTDQNLLLNSLYVVAGIFVVFFALNLFRDIYLDADKRKRHKKLRPKKNNNKSFKKVKNEVIDKKAKEINIEIENSDELSEEK